MAIVYFRWLLMKICNTICSVFIYLSTLTSLLCAQTVSLENDTIKVEVDKKTGCFTVIEKVTGQKWFPDQWEKSAAVLRIRGKNGEEELLNLSKCKEIEVIRSGRFDVKINLKHLLQVKD